MLRSSLVLLLLLGAAGSVLAQHALSNGPGPGTMSVTVDGWGGFGGCPATPEHTDLLFTNPQGAPATPTVCYSAVILEDLVNCSPAPPRRWLMFNPGPYPLTIPYQPANLPAAVIVPGRHVRTPAAALGNVCGHSIDVEQKLVGPDPASNPPIEGSTLQQIYRITNRNTAPKNISLIRLVDGDLGAAFTNDRGGASRRRADCGLAAPPYVSNREWVFEYDNVDLQRAVLAIAVEGTDQNGQPVKATNHQVFFSAAGHPVAAFLANPLGFLMGQIVGDTDGSLLIDGAELPGDYAMGQSIVFPMVPPGATVTAHFRTRLTALDKKNATPTDQQARDITCATWGGNVGGRKPGIPILCVNQRTDCAQVPVGSVALVQMSAPPMGPNPTHYVLFATLGHPKANTNCGAPGAADFALWGGGIHPWGVGAFPVSSLLGNWTGGDALPGFALASSIPGIGLITTPPATGPLPCGGGPPILGIPFIALPKFAFTLQALVVDFGSRQGTIQPISVTNAVQVAMGNCSCQLN